MNYSRTDIAIILAYCAVTIFGVLWVLTGTIALALGDPVLGYYPDTIGVWFLMGVYAAGVAWLADAAPPGV